MLRPLTVPRVSLYGNGRRFVLVQKCTARWVNTCGKSPKTAVPVSVAAQAVLGWTGGEGKEQRIKKDSGWNAKSYPGVGVGSDYNTELEEKLIEKLISELGGIKRDVAVRLLIAANRTVERAVGNHQLALAHHYAGQDKCDSTAEELSEDDKDMKDVYILAKSLDVDEHGASALLEAAGWNLARANAAVNRAQI
eukprot:202992-Rhodomonas_salina.1